MPARMPAWPPRKAAKRLAESDRVKTSQMKLLSRLTFPIAAAGLVAMAAVVPSHGPKKGYLVITGGGGGEAFVQRFIQMAGGAQARIVVIPTASVTHAAAPEQLARYCKAYAAAQCTVLHTTVPMVADTAAFAAPLRTATGVWLVGGRQWRLADAYLGTYTLKELFALLDRGGVIGGGSAGASIQASFMVRGDSVKDDNRIMIAPGHTTGFGFITNIAIDQHVDARRRENDLAVVMKAQPELLGLGLDQGTSITVHKDELVNDGPGRVAVWDGKDHDGKGYYYLNPGDRFDMTERTATLAPAGSFRDVPAKRIEGEAPLPREHKEIAVDPKLFEGYVGRYQLARTVVVNVTREGDHLFTQLTGQQKGEIFPEGERNYFLKVVDAQITFETDSQGRATGLVLHQNGRDMPAMRIEGETVAPPKHKEIAVDRKVFDRYVGRYELAPKFTLTVTRAGNRFFTQATGQPQIEVFPETERDYFLKGADVQITFATDNHGRATGLVLHDNGRDFSVGRIK
jgi:cyanophycinase